MPEPVDVAVLVDLYLEPRAGGHVKAWERFAEAAAAFPGELDLTVYFLGAELSEIPLCETVRYRTVPPRLGTRRIPFLRQGGGDTDLGRHNARLARFLRHHRVIHATSAFAFGRTGARVAARTGAALVYSIHTDVPKFTRIYTRDVLRNLFGETALTRLLADRVRVGELSARGHERRLHRLWRQSRTVLASNDADAAAAASVAGADRVARLRRGIDKERFHPRRRDRDWLAQSFGAPARSVLVHFAGRVDESKRVLTAARAVGLLRGEGLDVHLVVSGEGGAKREIRALLGGAGVTFTGNVDQDTLARVMASCDLFVFPSETETVGNVVIEAQAAGLPAILSCSGNSRHCLGADGVDGRLVPGQDPRAWAAALRPLAAGEQARAAMSAAARAHIERGWPSWQDVVGEDLLPVWRAAAGERSGKERAET
ncbi:MAG: glycosyltransferase [Alphaproteobacteria bacterium]